MADYDLICIGSGPAGEKAATQAAYYGYRVAIIEKAPTPGGAMVNTGTIPTKALRETALLCSSFKRRPIPGVDFSLDRNISVARFMARRHLIEEQEHDRIEQSMDRHGIDIVHGTATIAGPHEVAVTMREGEKRSISAEHILIATGSSPVRPDFVPFNHPGVVDADDVLDLARIPETMVIVGGGVIGCEYASIFAELGVGVTLIHPRDAVLPFLQEDIRANLIAAMQMAGVRFELETSVDAVDGEEDGAIVVSTGDGRTIQADSLLWTAGRGANTAGLGLEQVGVWTDDRGLIKVDEKYRTSVKSIYAAGDVIGFPALASTSMEQGRIAACHMFDLAFKFELAQVVPMGLYTIPAVSMVGLTPDDAVAKGHEVVVGKAHYRGNVRGRMLGDEQGMLLATFDRRSQQLLGASIVGEDATELIHLGQFAIANGLGMSDFLDACFNYPSLSELYKYACYDALQQMAREAESSTENAAEAA